MINRLKKRLALRLLNHLDIRELTQYVEDRQMKEFFDSAYGYMVNKVLELYKDEKHD